MSRLPPIKPRLVTDHYSYVGYSGVLTSPFFGQPTSVLNPRKIELGVRFVF